MSFRTVTGTRSVSSKDRMRGSVGSRTSGSRTRVLPSAEPKREPSIATAITRSAPWNSGTWNDTRALPSASATIGPDQKATGWTRRMPSVRTYWPRASAPAPPPVAFPFTSGSSRLNVS